MNIDDGDDDDELLALCTLCISLNNTVFPFSLSF